MAGGTCGTCKKDNCDITDGECEQCREEISSSQRRLATPCACEEEPTSVKAMMQCTGCERWWHFACVGLAGISKYTSNSITNWNCPTCFTFSEKITENLGIPGDRDHDKDNELRNEVKRQITAVVPDIVTQVVGGVTDALGETQVKDMMKQANLKITESWASIVKTQQSKMIGETVEKTAASALTKSMRLIDANLTEQRKRVRNAIVSGIPENSGTDENTSLVEVVVNVLSGEDAITVNDIVSCNRLGKKTAGKNRFVLVIFKKEDQAMFMHNWSRGRKLGEGSWVNPDFTKSEREAMYQERMERRRKPQRQPNRPGDQPGVRPAPPQGGNDQPAGNRVWDHPPLPPTGYRPAPAQGGAAQQAGNPVDGPPPPAAAQPRDAGNHRERSNSR